MWWNRVADMNIPLDVVEEYIILRYKIHGEIADVINFCLPIVGYLYSNAILKQRLFEENKNYSHEYLITMVC